MPCVRSSIFGWGEKRPRHYFVRISERQTDVQATCHEVWMLMENDPALYRQGPSSQDGGILPSGERGHGYDILREETRGDGFQEQPRQEDSAEEVRRERDREGIRRRDSRNHPARDKRAGHRMRWEERGGAGVPRHPCPDVPVPSGEDCHEVPHPEPQAGIRERIEGHRPQACGLHRGGVHRTA